MAQPVIMMLPSCHIDDHKDIVGRDTYIDAGTTFRLLFRDSKMPKAPPAHPVNQDGRHQRGRKVHVLMHTRT